MVEFCGIDLVEIYLFIRRLFGIFGIESSFYLCVFWDFFLIVFYCLFFGIELSLCGVEFRWEKIEIIY